MFERCSISGVTDNVPRDYRGNAHLVRRAAHHFFNHNDDGGDIAVVKPPGSGIGKVAGYGDSDSQS